MQADCNVTAFDIDDFDTLGEVLALLPLLIDLVLERPKFVKYLGSLAHLHTELLKLVDPLHGVINFLSEL